MAEEKLYTFYKIVCKNENIKDCYVGKTKNLKDRIRTHKNKCNNEICNEFNNKIYQFIRNNGGFDNFIFVELEKDYYCDKDSGIRERFWINELKANLNKIIPTRTSKEYRENNKEKKKEYYEKNKEKFKEYYEKNKEKIKERLNEYYEKNKDEINRQKRERRKNKRFNKLSNENIE